MAWLQELTFAPLHRPPAGVSFQGDSRPLHGPVGNAEAGAGLGLAPARLPSRDRHETLSDQAPECGAGVKPEGGASRHFARPEAGAGGRRRGTGQGTARQRGAWGPLRSSTLWSWPLSGSFRGTGKRLCPGALSEAGQGQQSWSLGLRLGLGFGIQAQV